MSATPSENPWQTKLIKPKLGLFAQPLRAADIVASLCEITLARRYVVEDVDYRKIVPNRFVVELPEENYQRNYRLIERKICQQWRDHLLSHLTNANSRQGRHAYRFAGPVSVEIRPVSDLAVDAARILFCLETETTHASAPTILPACLETSTADHRWSLHEGIVTLGREVNNDIFLDVPAVQEKKLVSGQHAYLRCTRGDYRLFDGTPRGQASTNGTYVNYRRVPPVGVALQNGDLILLAALNPNAPNLETPGVAVLRFRADCTK
jgi:hypothetical protein